MTLIQKPKKIMACILICSILYMPLLNVYAFNANQPDNISDYTDIASDTDADLSTERMATATDALEDALNGSVDWLENNQNSDGSWGNSNLIVDTTDVLKVAKNDNCIDMAVSWLEENYYEDDVDSLSRFIISTNDLYQEMDLLLDCQNSDGGFGLTRNYTSDPLDTLLATEAMICNADKYKADIDKAILYLVSNQNQDGGWGLYRNSSDIELTSRIATVISLYLNHFDLYSSELNNRLELADKYLTENYNLYSNEDISVDLNILLFKLERNVGINLKEIQDYVFSIQKSDGRLGEEIIDNVLAIQVIRKLQYRIQEKTSIKKMTITPEIQFVYCGNDVDIQINADIYYSAKYDVNYTMNLTIEYEDKKVVKEEINVPLSKDDSQISLDLSSGSVTPRYTGNIMIKAAIFDEEGTEVCIASCKVPVRLKNTDTDVLLIENTAPWSKNTNHILLNKLEVSYDKLNSSDVINTELSKYRVIILANDQYQNFYDDIGLMKEKFEEFVTNGGTLVYGVCDGGWANGTSMIYIPGDIKVTRDFQNYNVIRDESHPIVTAEYSDGIPIENKDLFSNYASHIHFDKDSLPDNCNVILETLNGEPTLIEYQIGKGTVIASGLTWEHNYQYGDWASFAPLIMDDYFLYALNITYTAIEEEPGSISSVITIDKEEYQAGEEMNIHITSEIERYKRIVSEQVVVTDINDNVIEILSEDLSQEIIKGKPIVKDYKWDVPDILAGEYKIKISWYDGEEYVGGGEKTFIVPVNGQLVNDVSVVEESVVKGNDVAIKDNITNNSTNHLANDLEVIFTILDSEGTEIKSYKNKVEQIRNDSSECIEQVACTSELECGMYTVISRVYQYDVLQSEDSCVFELIEIEEEEEIISLTASLEASPDDLYNNLSVKYVLNNGSIDLEDKTFTVTILRVINEFVTDIITDDITLAAFETYESNKDIDISNYESGDYLVILSADLGDENEALAYSYFTVPERTHTYFDNEYTLVALQDGITLNCYKTFVDGNIYSGNNFDFGGSILNVQGRVDAVGSINAYGWIIDILERRDNYSQLSFNNPINTIIDDIKLNAQRYDEIGAYNNYDITIPTLCDSTTGAYSTNVNILNHLVSKDTISLNANSVVIGQDENCILACEDGDININATYLDVNGVIYAPNGTVTLNINECNMNGMIIAKKIVLNGTTYNFNKTLTK